MFQSKFIAYNRGITWIPFRLRAPNWCNMVLGMLLPKWVYTNSSLICSGLACFIICTIRYAIEHAIFNCSFNLKVLRSLCLIYVDVDLTSQPSNLFQPLSGFVILPPHQIISTWFSYYSATSSWPINVDIEECYHLKRLKL